MIHGFDALRLGSIALNFFVVFFVSFPGIIKTIRERRTLQRIRISILAYEKELLERGVTIPARCCYCLQLLPRHVEGCFAEEDYKYLGWLFECLTRPPIQFSPRNKPEIKVREP
jgi:hypothetical protein